MRCEISLAGTAAILTLAATIAQAANDWPSYNRTLTGDRYASLEAIDSKNVAGLKILCTFDTGEQSAFQTGVVEVDGALFGTTEHDTFSIDPNNCKQNWRSHEDFPSSELKVNRGVAWLDAGTYDSLLSSSLFVQTLEQRQGLKIACLEEIALLKGFIDIVAFGRLADAYGNSDYGSYLRRVASEYPKTHGG